MRDRILLVPTTIGILSVLALYLLDRRVGRSAVLRPALTAWSLLNIAFVVYLWFNHAPFSLHLDLMEGTVFQHFQRAVAGQPVYPAPAPDYVALAYNPLYYYLAVPFGWALGVSVFTLRVVAILGMLGSGLAVFAVVRRNTRSPWWGLVATGLFAAAYRVMDTYLDNAHSDSWFLCAALWGTYLLDQKRSRLVSTGGVLLLIASFWFKQHGALFAIGGVVWLAWRHGLRRSAPYWLAAAVGGPVLYLFAGPTLFGSHFHYFTWEVPSHWSTLNARTILRPAAFTALGYPLLSVLSGLAVFDVFRRSWQAPGVWPFQWIFACASGLMGALDPGSANNVFIAMGTWFIIVGTIELHRFALRSSRAGCLELARLTLALSFVALLYDPRTVIVSSKAVVAYDDLISLLNGLDGTVYAPTIGQLERGYILRPAAHWAPLDDMVRGPRRDVRNHPETRRLLSACLHPKEEAYLLAHYRLANFDVIDFLSETYVLEQDLGDRFLPLSVLPKRWHHGWPRFLYRYDGARGQAPQTASPRP